MEAGGTYPTEMLSCLCYFSSRKTLAPECGLSDWMPNWMAREKLNDVIPVNRLEYSLWYPIKQNPRSWWLEPFMSFSPRFITLRLINFLPRLKSWWVFYGLCFLSLIAYRRLLKLLEAKIQFSYKISCTMMIKIWLCFNICVLRCGQNNFLSCNLYVDP